MPQLVPWLIFLHVLTAIVAFGPTFAFSVYGAQSGKEPQHANFMARANLRVSERVVLPLALTMPVTGLLMVWAAGIDLTRARWLALAIVLYVIALSFSWFIQRPATMRLVALTATPPPPGASGPPPELTATVRRIQRGGMFTGLLIILIVALMVVKPAF
jgi:uncharacterized membrane protein